MEQSKREDRCIMKIMEEKYELYNGDCLEIMDKLIEKGIKVDMILCDLPYGVTNKKRTNGIALYHLKIYGKDTIR